MHQVISGSIAGIQFEATLVTTDDELRIVVERLQGIRTVALDMETTGYEGQKDYGPGSGEIRLVQLAWYKRGELNVVVIDGKTADLSLLVPFFEGPAKKVVHYSPFERQWISHHLGAKLEGVIDTCYLGQSINKNLRGKVAKALVKNKEDFTALQRALFKKLDYMSDEVYELPSGREVTAHEVDKARAKVACSTEMPPALRNRSGPRGWQLDERATLAAMAKRYLGQDLDKEGQTSDWSGWLTSEQLLYAAGDAVVTLTILEPVSKTAKALRLYSRTLRRSKHDLERG
jgi:ribonuclease D